MTFREFAGLALLSIAFVLAPFGYWLSFKWALVAIGVGVVGTFLYFTARVAKKFKHQDETGASNVYPSKETKGFNGSSIFDSNDD
jgi:hypothetical protein